MIDEAAQARMLADLCRTAADLIESDLEFWHRCDLYAGLGLTVSAICEALEIDRSTYYRKVAVGRSSF